MRATWLGLLGLIALLALMACTSGDKNTRNDEPVSAALEPGGNGHLMQVGELSYSLTVVGAPEGTGDYASATGINASGQMSIARVDTSGYGGGFYWSSTEGFVSVGSLGGLTTSADFINDAGQIAGISQLADSSAHAFLWSAGGGMTDLSPSATHSEAMGLNASGQVAIMTSEPGVPWKCWRWDPTDGLVDLGAPEDQWCSPADINAEGHILGTLLDSSNNRRAFLWTEAQGFTDLGDLGATSPSFIVPIDMNDANQIVGQIGVPNPDGSTTYTAFFWSPEGGLVNLTPSLGGTAVSINNRGEVIGARIGVGSFYWSEATGLLDATGPDAALVRINDTGLAIGAALVTIPDPRGRLKKANMPVVWTLVDGIVPLPLSDDGSITSGKGNSAAYLNNRGEIVGSVTVTELGVSLSRVALWEPVMANADPVAADDSAATDEDTSALVNVLANDSDTDGDPLAIESVGTPGHGTASDAGGGSVLYTPDPDFFGGDSFSYTITDGHGGSATGAVSVTVNPVNDPPVAQNDAVSTDEDVPLVIDVLVNDTDIDSATLSVVAATDGAIGTVTINPDQTVTYTPDPDVSGTDQFGYTILDTEGLESSAVVSVEVYPVNDEPFAANDSASTTVDGPLVIDVLANDFDPEGDPIGVVAVTDGAHGTVTGNGDGTVSYLRDAGFNGSDSFTYSIEDSGGASATGTVSVIVLVEVNLPPGSSIGDGTTLDPNARLGRNSSIGDNGTVGAGSQVKQGAAIGDGAVIGDNVNVGQNATVGDGFTAGDGSDVKQGAQVGNDVTLGTNATVGQNANIGDGTTLQDGASVKQGAQVGSDVTVGAGANVGQGAQIGDGTAIGADSQVRQGAHLGAGASIGADVGVGQNVTIGDGAVIGDNTTIKQGASIGAGAHIGANVTIGQNAHIGVGATVADGSTLRQNTVVPDYGSYP